MKMSKLLVVGGVAAAAYFLLFKRGASAAAPSSGAVNMRANDARLKYAETLKKAMESGASPAVAQSIASAAMTAELQSSAQWTGM
jgi:hypothetical protein